MDKKELTKNKYDFDFYKNRDSKTRYSARKILGLLSNIYDFHSAVDLGCGVGTWLSVCQDISRDARIRGYDGDYVNRELLQIKNEYFTGINLENRVVDESKYDLAISLEVAEHLSPERAVSFVEDITNLADVILFSAAVPMQPGTGHINCQLPSYWGGIFSSFGYEQFDIIRPEIWDDKEIPVWYRQNILVYVKKSSIIYKDFCNVTPKRILDIIHPDEYISHHNLLMKEIDGFKNSKYVKIRRKIHELFGKREK